MDKSHWDWDGLELNVLSNPEDCGLELIGTVHNDCEEYGFDIDIVVRDLASGKLFHGWDSGCSCPIPFEDVHCLADLKPVNKWEARKILGRNF